MDYLAEQERKIHPKERNNFISNIFFIYAIKLYRKGFSKDLNENDLYEVLSDYRSKKLGDQLEKEWEKQKKKNLSIISLLLSCYGLRYLMLGFVQLVLNVAEIVILPHALGKLVGYFKIGQTEMSKSDAYFYAAVVIGFNFFECVYKHNYHLELMAFGLRLRVAFSSFIYRKALKLSPAHLGDISIGKLVTLTTKDVETFSNFILFGNDVWIGILKTVIVSFVLYKKIGIATLAGVGVFLVVIPLQIYLGTLVTSLKMLMCKKTDERLQITQETLSAIRIIKMYTWENIFNNKISEARKKEVHTIFKIFVLRFIILVLGSLTSNIAFYVMMSTYIVLGNNITAEILYFIVTTFDNLTYGLSILLPLGVYHTAEIKSAIKRIGNVLKAMDVETARIVDDAEIIPKIILTSVTVAIKNHKILENIDLEIEQGLTLITGPVGSGKSFLVKTILQDYKPEEGRVEVRGNISYASQEPWLFPSSIKQNILFGEKHDEKRYQEVLKVCALLYDFELLEHGDGTIVEDRGINLSKGQQARINLARALYKESDIYLLDDSLSALDAHVNAFIFKECVEKFLKDKIVILVTHNVNYMKNANMTVCLNKGQLKLIKTSDMEEKNNLLDITTEQIDQNGEYEEDDTQENIKLLTETTNQKKVYQEDKNSGEVNFDVYKKYVRFGGGFFAFLCVFCIYGVSQICRSYTDKLTSEWVNLEDLIANSSSNNETASMDELAHQRTILFYLYSFFTAATAITLFVRAFALLFLARTAAMRIHKSMITNIISAAMNFFDTNFIGNVLNRFSKDLTVVDEQIAFSIHQVTRVFFFLIGTMTLIASVNTVFIIPAVIFFTILVILRRMCLRTTRNLKRLDALTKSPVVGHINATLEGLTTIRAFKAQQILRDEFDRHQDLYTSASYIFQSSMRAFGFIIHIFSVVFVMLIVLRFLVFEDGTLAGHVGLAISQSFLLTSLLQWGVRQWAEVENQMTSVERVLEYTNIKEESKEGLLPEKWPTKGEVKYSNVYLSYTNSNNHVLKNINLIVKSREKIGIVGRTGAGKSSIMSTLFRLYDVEGKISIDDIDIKTIPLEYLRKNISIIPQDPVLFTGTIRENIDPTGTYTDDAIWRAIETVNLKTLVPRLDLEIREAGANFSIGQKQLICMARAVIQNNKIIVLDEATANMDAETDALIHKTIDKNFSNCTVFTIAHKLHSILKADKVIVMDKGDIIEFGEPGKLMKNKNGIFYKMVAKAGLSPQSK